MKTTLKDINLKLKIRIGKRKIRLNDIINADINSVFEFNKKTNDPVELIINDKIIGIGEIVVVDGNFGIQIIELYYE